MSRSWRSRVFNSKAYTTLTHHSTQARFLSLLDNEELADSGWEAWDAGEIDELAALYAWQLMLLWRNAKSVNSR